MTRITRTQAEALASFVCRVRTDWRQVGTVENILKCEDAWPLDIAHALLNLAADATIKTPGLLAQDGPHWRSKAPADPPPPRPIVCPTHHIQHSVSARCPSCAGDEKAHTEEFEPVSEPARTRTAPPDFTDLRRRLEDVKHQQRAKVESIRAGGAS